MSTEAESQQSFEELAAGYRQKTLSRRDFLGRIAVLTGGMAAAQLLLERNGLAATLISDVESDAAGVAASTVSYNSASGQGLGGYLCVPAGAGRHPGIIVIHENRGLNEQIRDVTRRFATAGYTALAPDLLSRWGGTDKVGSPDEARDALMGMAPDEAGADLMAAVEFLRAHPRADPDRLSCVGFCWGGARSFALAAQSDKLRAAVVFYGSTPPTEQLVRIHCPVLGLYGAEDERISSKVPATVVAMRAAAKTFDYHVYPNCGHAFFNDTGPNYNEAAAHDAWKRTLEFLKANNG